MGVTAIIVAAGRGSRAGEGGPKQYRMLRGKTILARTIGAFLKHEKIDQVRVIIHKDDTNLYNDAVATLIDHPKLMTPVFGGAERQDSVRLGLESLEDQNPENVLIHDAARPFIDSKTINNVIDALRDNEGAIAALPVFDTIKASDNNSQISRTVPREGLWRAQTPQGFVYQKILKAHRSAKGKVLTDDASVCEDANIPVVLVAGAPDNMKITQAEDFGMAEILLHRKDKTESQSMWEYRSGQGYDVHAFEPGNAAILCGVSIPHSAKLKGHSDADVGMHALADAILGAIGEGDIGDHFPPSDPQWKGAASEIFLKKACALVRERGGEIIHCDITLICEAPKIGPHRSAMRNALGKIMDISPKDVSVKATTTEKLGFTGREEGIAASAIATVKLPTEA